MLVKSAVLGRHLQHIHVDAIKRLVIVGRIRFRIPSYPSLWTTHDESAFYAHSEPKGRIPQGCDCCGKCFVPVNRAELISRLHLQSHQHGMHQPPTRPVGGLRKWSSFQGGWKGSKSTYPGSGCLSSIASTLTFFYFTRSNFDLGLKFDGLRRAD